MTTQVDVRELFEMTAEELERIIAASKPVPLIIIGGVEPPSAQENANAAWAVLGDKYGFDHMTVRPTSDKGDRFFTAIKRPAA